MTNESKLGTSNGTALTASCQDCKKHFTLCDCKAKHQKTENKHDKTNQFYFQGKFFHTFEEMEAYTNEWNDLPLDQETAERQLRTLSKEIVMNTFLRGANFTNQQFKEYVNGIFEYSIISLPGSPKE